MTWRVAILAFTIMLAGATAPLIRDAVGGRAGYRVMGVAMALIIVVGVVSAYVGTRRAPVGASQPGAGHAARPAADRRRRARLPAAADHASSCRRSPPAACSPASTTWPPTCSTARAPTTILFVCFVGPALLLTPAWSAIGTRIGKKRGYLVVLGDPRRRRAARRAGPVGAVRLVVCRAVALVGVGYAGCQVFPLAMLPDAAAVDARRTGSSTGSASTPASGPPARRSASRSARGSSRWCWRSAATGPAPTATSPSRTRR